MAFRISSNVASLSAQRSLEKSQRQSEKSLKALASGSRIVSAGDDAAGFAIAEGLRGQLSGTKQARFNAQNAMSMVQTAEGGLNEQNNILIRLRELAVYSASDTIGDEEREFLDQEFQSLTAEFDRIARSTTFGNKKLLTGTGERFSFQVGANRGDENTIQFTLDADTTADEVGIDGLGVADKGDALDALDELDSALLKVAGTRAGFGAVQSRFQFAIDNLSVQADNIEQARSLIVDVDVAEEVTNLTRAQILQDIGTAVLAQANNDKGRALRLIG